MGKTHASSLSNDGNVTLLMCCDTNPQKAKDLKNTYHIEQITSDAGHLITHPDIDVVYITSTTNSHFDLFSLAVKHKKHILIEKPLALTAAESYKFYQLAKNTSAVCMSGFKFRFYSLVKKAKQLIPNPYMVQVQIIDDPWPADFWANDPKLGGGNVISQGVHGTDLLRFFIADEPRSVFAAGANYHQPTGVIDNISATFQFKNGTAASLMVGDCGTLPVSSKFSVQIFGSQGSIFINNRLTKLYYKPANSSNVEEFTGSEDGFEQENKEFLEAVRKNQTAPCTIFDGFMAQEMIDAAIRSLDTNTLQTINQTYPV